MNKNLSTRRYISHITNVEITNDNNHLLFIMYSNRLNIGKCVYFDYGFILYIYIMYINC